MADDASDTGEETPPPDSVQPAPHESKPRSRMTDWGPLLAVGVAIALLLLLRLILPLCGVPT
jgi:hypothetical protein